MRFLIAGLLFSLSLAAFSEVPKDGNSGSLNFGMAQFNIALSYNSNNDVQQLAHEKLTKQIAFLTKRQVKYKKETQFAEYAFYYIHKKLLKHYIQYASISQTVAFGIYDCVTATAIYSLFLTELNIPFSVVETNYHIYILIYPRTEQEVLLETTDPLYGFITNKTEIATRKIRYAQSNTEHKVNQANINWNVATSLKGDELIGILLFNQSVKQFNLNHKLIAKKLAEEALIYYKRNRIKTYISFINNNQYASK